MKAVLFGILVAVAGYFTVNSLSEAAIDDMQFDHPIVVELFTSQSCSSCPPADALVQTLMDNDENIIVLACHVDYWNHLHWKDDLSHAFCTKRQKNYEVNILNRQVFTPQVLVNGTHSATGSVPFQVSSALNRAKQNPLLKVDISQTNTDKELQINLPKALQDKDNLFMSLVVIDTSLKSREIKRGENRGKTLTYRDTVSALRDGKLPNKVAEFKIDDMRKTSDERLAILIHNGQGGPIIAAGKI